jgi:eukaryotic-like serine/threonine-protein kinase
VREGSRSEGTGAALVGDLSPLSRLLQELVALPEKESASSGGSQLHPGDRVGRFEIQREVGHGGFGVVFEAHDTGLGRQVALKLIRPGAPSQAPARLESIQQEAEAVARLTHPNIVTLFDFGTCDAGPYLVMELLHGESLQHRLRRGPFTLREALGLSIEVARALDHAHGAGVLHRDLKPANLFLTRDGLVKVLDFGLALVLGAARRSEGGSPGYMSPEQRRAGPQDGRSDVWSAAVILYQLLAGEFPFHPESAWTDESAGAERAPSIPGAPPSLNLLLQRALAVEPASRPADGRAWLEALREVQAELEAAPRVRSPATRIAVLPFSGPGAGDGGDLLADSLTALLISELSRAPALRVTSRTTAMAYRGTTKPLREIGAEVAVDKIVEGSVLRAGDLLEIRVRLLDAPTEREEWAEHYRQPIGTVFDVLDGIATEVLGALGALFGPPQPGSGGGRAFAPRAVDDYMRGQYHQSKRSPEGFAAALAEYRAASDGDPLFPAPYVGTAFVHLMSAIYGYASPRQAFSLARPNAERGLALDPGSGEALGALAGVQLFHDHDFAEALRTARRAVQLNPSHVMSRVVLGDVLWLHDAPGEAMAQIEAALRLDPLDLGINMNVGDFLIFGRRFDEAVSALQALLRLNPHFLPGHIRLARALAFAGRRAGAETELELVAASAPEPAALEVSALCLGVLGEVGRARPLAQELDRRAFLGGVPAMAAANAWAALGEAGAALPWLERAWQEREPGAVMAATYPATRGLFDGEAFAAFGRRAGIPRFKDASPPRAEPTGDGTR